MSEHSVAVGKNASYRLTSYEHYLKLLAIKKYSCSWLLPSSSQSLLAMDYYKTVSTSQLLADRGSNLVVINPGSANIRIGLAQQDSPVSVPHCIARRTHQVSKKNVQDQLLNSPVTTVQYMERERAYDIIASLLKIRFLDEEVVNNQYTQKMGRVDGLPPQSNIKTVIPWTNVFETTASSSSPEGSSMRSGESLVKKDDDVKKECITDPKYRESIFGEEALRISPAEPYCLRRPIRRGHLNISPHYPAQQVIEDMNAIWDWVLVEKLNIPRSKRHMYSAVLVVPETLDSREVKELLSIVLRDLCFSTAVVHQEVVAAAYGNGVQTACIVNIGAQMTSVICIEELAALPTTQISLQYGGEDISRCLLWTQRHHRTWPQICTDALTKPIDLLMLNRLKESHCHIREGEVEAVAVVHAYEDGAPPVSHRTRLIALNVPPMGLFYPSLLVPDIYPQPPRTWFSDYEDMLEDTWDFSRRPDMSDGYFPGTGLFPMWENYPMFQIKPKKQDMIGLAEAITKSILSTGRIDLQRKLFCNMLLVGGVALTGGLISAVEERVLHAIPSHEAIDTVEVLQSRTNPSFAAWKGGAILGILDFTREQWIGREDWINNGVLVGSKRKKDPVFIQAQAMCYINN